MKKYISTFLKLLLAVFLFSTALLFLLAYLLYHFYLSDRVVAASVTIICVVSVFAGGFLAGKLAGQKKYLWGLCLGMGYFVVLLLVSMIVRQSFAPFDTGMLTTMLLCLAGGMLGGMLS